MRMIFAAKWAFDDDIEAGYPASNRGGIGSLCHDEISTCLNRIYHEIIALQILLYCSFEFRGVK